jgi:hypothetical protein
MDMTVVMAFALVMCSFVLYRTTLDRDDDPVATGEDLAMTDCSSLLMTWLLASIINILSKLYILQV